MISQGGQAVNSAFQQAGINELLTSPQDPGPRQRSLIILCSKKNNRLCAVSSSHSFETVSLILISEIHLLHTEDGKACKFLIFQVFSHKYVHRCVSYSE